MTGGKGVKYLRLLSRSQLASFLAAFVNYVCKGDNHFPLDLARFVS